MSSYVNSIIFLSFKQSPALLQCILHWENFPLSLSKSVHQTKQYLHRIYNLSFIGISILMSCYDITNALKLHYIQTLKHSCWVKQALKKNLPLLWTDSNWNIYKRHTINVLKVVVSHFWTGGWKRKQLHNI